MALIRCSIGIRAPIARCFDLARNVDVHVASTHGTGERAVGGVTTGLMGLGDEVTWEARHLGVVQRLTSRITAFEPPVRFRDSMVRGAFRRFDHDHLFEADGDGTVRMHDVFDYHAPLGPLGRFAEAVFLTRYLRRFLESRALVIKRVAESGEWRAFLPE